MGKILNFLPFVAVVIVMLLLFAECKELDALKKENSPIIYTENLLDGDFYLCVDKETGVNYILAEMYGSIGLCPRYNADGTLYVSEVE